MKLRIVAGCGCMLFLKKCLALEFDGYFTDFTVHNWKNFKAPFKKPKGQIGEKHIRAEKRKYMAHCF